MKNLIRKFTFFILYYLGIGLILKKRNRKKGKIPVLLFHRISNHKDPFWEPMQPLVFKNTIALLTKKYNFISVDELFELPKKNLSNACLITFDDGYNDFLEFALPILEENKIRSCFFITTNCINNNELIWTSELNKAIDQTKSKEVNVKIKNDFKTYHLVNQLDKSNVAKELIKNMENLSNHERITILEKLKQDLSYQKPVDINMMTWTDINKIARSTDIHSHTMSHPFLDTLDDHELEVELRFSKEEIKKNINKEVKYFSYPIGSYNKNVLNETKKKYTAAFAVNNKLVQLDLLEDENYKYQIPRINITDNSKYEIFFRMNGFHEKITQLLKRTQSKNNEN